MSKHRHSPQASRRNFLKGAGLVGAAAAVTPPIAANAIPAGPQEQLKAAVPGPRQIAAETMPPASDPVNQTSSGGDFMTDVLNSLGIEYLAINCASSYRGLHEAVINHGNNKPEIITCVHEDIAVHLAQGYAKIEGKPIAMACHGVVGLQHATMAMYNAWCDRVPVMVFGGNIMEADKRGPGGEWVHSAVDVGAIVRDFTKWDDQPASLQHFAESAVRAYKIATTPPMGPVFLALDAELQENPIRDRGKPAHPEVRTGDSAAGRFRARSRKPRKCWSRRKIRHHLRSRGAHAGGHGEPRRPCRDAAMRRHRQRRPHEFSVAAPAQSELPQGV